MLNGSGGRCCGVDCVRWVCYFWGDDWIVFCWGMLGFDFRL